MCRLLESITRSNTQSQQMSHHDDSLGQGFTDMEKEERKIVPDFSAPIPPVCMEPSEMLCS